MLHVQQASRALKGILWTSGVVALVTATVLAVCSLPAAAVASTGVPGAPSDVHAVANEGSATVSWVAPADPGAAPIVAYQLTVVPGSMSMRVPGTSLVATVPGLKDGTSYTFTVVASNSYGAGPASLPSNPVVPTHEGGVYVPLSPYRICDTRPGNPSSLKGIEESQCEGKTLGSGDTLTIQVAGTYLCTQSSCSSTSSDGVPSSGVDSVALNVTAVDTTKAGYLTVWPAGEERPSTSNLDWVPGRVVANLVQVRLPRSGKISIYNAVGSVNVVVDVEGYTTNSQSSAIGLFHPLSSYRICDTRPGNPSSLKGIEESQCEGKTLGSGDTLTIQVAGTNPSGKASGGVPLSGVQAVVLTVTAISPSLPTYLSVYPAGSTLPTASNLNLGSGQTISNSVVTGLSNGGKVSIHNFAGEVNIAVNVDGWFSAAGSSSLAGSYYIPLDPSRICDTRSPAQIGGLSELVEGVSGQCANSGIPLQADTPLLVDAAGLAGVPSFSSPVPPTAVVVNVTITNTTSSGYLTAWPAGQGMPVASMLNWTKGQTVSDLITVDLGNMNGQIEFELQPAVSDTGSADLVVDLEGYYAGGTVVPPSTVVLDTQSLGLLSMVSNSDTSILFSGSDAQLATLVPGDVLSAPPSTADPYGLMVMVTAVRSTPSGGVAITAQPANPLQALAQGDFQFNAAAVDYTPKVNLEMASLAEGGGGSGVKSNAATSPINSTFTCSTGVSGPKVSLSAGFSRFQVAPQLSLDAGVSWSGFGNILPQPYANLSANITVDETYTLAAVVSAASASFSCTYTPYLHSSPLSQPFVVWIGPIPVTITPVLTVSTPFTASGSASAATEVGITQSGFAEGGFTYSLGGSFSTSFEKGCEPPATPTTPMCVTLMKEPPLVQASLKASMGVSVAVTAALDYVPGGPLMGPSLEVAPAIVLNVSGNETATKPMQPQAQWSIGVTIPIKLGVVLDWNWWLINLNLDQYWTLYDLSYTPFHSIEIVSTSLPGATVGKPYDITLVGSGGAPPYTWAVTSGQLPSGLDLNPTNGVISGVPRSDGMCAFNVTATDVYGFSATATLSIQVGASPSPVGGSCGSSSGSGSSVLQKTLDLSCGQFGSILAQPGELSLQVMGAAGGGTYGGSGAFEEATYDLTAPTPLSYTVGCQGGSSLSDSNETGYGAGGGGATTASQGGSSSAVCVGYSCGSSNVLIEAGGGGGSGSGGGSSSAGAAAGYGSSSGWFTGSNGNGSGGGAGGYTCKASTNQDGVSTDSGGGGGGGGPATSACAGGGGAGGLFGGGGGGGGSYVSPGISGITLVTDSVGGAPYFWGSPQGSIQITYEAKVTTAVSSEHFIEGIRIHAVNIGHLVLGGGEPFVLIRVMHESDRAKVLFWSSYSSVVM